MTQEKVGFGEQTINKMAALAIASQLEQAEQIEVQIKTNIKKLAKGEVDSVAIQIRGLLVQQTLVVEELRLQIGRVMVKPFSALRGKIKLVHPSQGTLFISANEAALNHALNADRWRERTQQDETIVNPARAFQIEQVNCSLSPEGYITFNSNLCWMNTGEIQSYIFAATPEIESSGKGLCLHVRSAQETLPQETLPELVSALSTRLSKVFGLSDFEQKGTTLQIQQIDVEADKITLQAAAYIEQFPS